MTTEFLIEDHSIHLWQLFLPDFFHQEKDLLALLNEEELERANRFYFPEHRSRFLTARAMLRKILSLYSHQNAKEIIFSYGSRGKPFLKHNPLNIQFNVSHSYEMAVYALTKTHDIGVDIERIETKDHDDIAKRYFSPKEFEDLQKLAPEQRQPFFYKIWSRKEAVIKALGEGLYAPLENFSVSLEKNSEDIEIVHNEQRYTYHLESFAVPAGYEAAFAVNGAVKKIVNCEWREEGE